MKIVREKQEVSFQPFVVKLTFETQEELDLARAFFMMDANLPDPFQVWSGVKDAVTRAQSLMNQMSIALHS